MADDSAARPRSALFRVRDVVTAAGSRYLPVERLVALALADHMNGTSGEAWPSVRTLATWAGVHDATVKRVLRVLCGAGEPSRAAVGAVALFDHVPGGSPAGGKRQSSTYRLKATLPTPGAQSDRSHGATGRTTRHDRVHGAPRPGAQGDVTGCTTHYRRDDEGTIEGMMNGAGARSIEQIIPQLADHFRSWYVGLGTDKTPGAVSDQWPLYAAVPDGTRMKVVNAAAAAMGRHRATA